MRVRRPVLLFSELEKCQSDFRRDLGARRSLGAEVAEGRRNRRSTSDGDDASSSVYLLPRYRPPRCRTPISTGCTAVPAERVPVS